MESLFKSAMVKYYTVVILLDCMRSMLAVAENSGVASSFEKIKLSCLLNVVTCHVHCHMVTLVKDLAKVPPAWCHELEMAGSSPGEAVVSMDRWAPLLAARPEGVLYLSSVQLCEYAARIQDTTGGRWRMALLYEKFQRYGSTIVLAPHFSSPLSCEPKNHLYDRFPDALREVDNAIELQKLCVKETIEDGSINSLFVLEVGDKFMHKHIVKPCGTVDVADPKGPTGTVLPAVLPPLPVLEASAGLESSIFVRLFAKPEAVVGDQKSGVTQMQMRSQFLEEYRNKLIYLSKKCGNLW